MSERDTERLTLQFIFAFILMWVIDSNRNVTVTLALIGANILFAVFGVVMTMTLSYLGGGRRS